jgi:hypothetical protein
MPVTGSKKRTANHIPERDTETFYRHADGNTPTNSLCPLTTKDAAQILGLSETASILGLLGAN